jgi:hypothetical protein
MKTTGTIVYDPVHRVPGKQEIAYKRTAAQDMIGHLARLLPHKALGGQTFKQSRAALEAFISDPHYWTRLGKDQAPPAAVKSFYALVEQVRTTTDDALLTQDLAALESKMIKTEIRPWTAIIKVDPQATAGVLKQLRSQGIKISQPAWGPHITWVRGERPPNQWGHNTYDGPPKWNLFNGRSVALELDPVIQSNAKGHYWLNIIDSKIESIETDLRWLRYSLGLNPDPKIPLHLTIGKLQ